jgi:hypothetical protein
MVIAGDAPSSFGIRFQVRSVLFTLGDVVTVSTQLSKASFVTCTLTMEPWSRRI